MKTLIYLDKSKADTYELGFCVMAKVLGRTLSVPEFLTIKKSDLQREGPPNDR